MKHSITRPLTDLEKIPISQGLVTLSPICRVIPTLQSSKTLPQAPPLKIVFHEQSYSCLHSGQSLAWDHFLGVIAYP